MTAALDNSKTVAALRAAAVALANVDQDRARNLNGVGYNGRDSDFGHSCAETPETGWSPRRTYAAWTMLRKYRRQLATYGIDFDAIDEPVDPATVAVERAASGEKSGSISNVSGGFAVSLAGVADFSGSLAAVKALDGRRFDGATKLWIVTDSPVNRAALATIAESYSVAIDERVDLSTDVDLSTTDAPLAPAKRISVAGSGLAIEFPYDVSLVAAVRGVDGATWRKDEKRWVAPATPSAIEFGRTNGFEIDEAAVALVGGHAAAIADRAVASRAEDAEIEIAGLGAELHPFQRGGVAYALDAKRVIIGDEMGLGKTVQALATAQAADAFPLIVVCPNLVKLNWLREIDFWLPGRSVSLMNGRKSVEIRKLDGSGSRTIETNRLDAEIIVVNYDILGKHLDALLALDAKTVVLDESQYVKNPKAKRTTAATKLVANAEYRLLLTGTPVLNRPSELISQLKVLDRLDEFGGFWRFAKRYCEATRNAYGWDLSGASNLEELNRKLRESCFVRRVKRDVLADLPPIQRQTISFEIENRREYDAAARAIVRWLGEQAARDDEFLREISDLDADEQKLAIADRRKSAESSAQRAKILVEMNALRQLAARGKIEPVAEWIETTLDSTDEKMIVFAWHVEIQNAILDRFPGAARIAAEDDPAERQRNVERFQNDDECKLIVCSINAGGVGITLTAAQTVAFVELPWRPADIDQAEGRAYGRLNDAHGVNSYYLVGENTIDEDMAELIDAKRSVVDAATDGRSGTSGAGILSSLVSRLTGRVSFAGEDLD